MCFVNISKLIRPLIYFFRYIFFHIWNDIFFTVLIVTINCYWLSFSVYIVIRTCSSCVKFIYMLRFIDFFYVFCEKKGVVILMRETVFAVSHFRSIKQNVHRSFISGKKLTDNLMNAKLRNVSKHSY